MVYWQPPMPHLPVWKSCLLLLITEFSLQEGARVLVQIDLVRDRPNLHGVGFHYKSSPNPLMPVKIHQVFDSVCAQQRTV